jgi:hypothetical protein
LVQVEGRKPRKTGPVPVTDTAETKRLAKVEFERNAEAIAIAIAIAIDAWPGDGEIFRLTREVFGCGPIPDAAYPPAP